MGYILDHRTSLAKLKRIETIPSMFSDHSEMKFKISKRIKLGNSPRYTNRIMQHEVTSGSKNKL